MKRKCKILVDIVMFFLFLYLMSYRAGRGLLLHGLLGSTLLGLFLVHHLLNLRWYAGLAKGNYSPVRIAFLAIDMLLLVAMAGMAVSSVLLSGNIFRFSPFFGTPTARTLHSFSTSWGFVLMLLHLGLHTHIPLEQLRKKAEITVFGYAYQLFLYLFLAAGLICFAKSSLWRNMMLISKGNPAFTPLTFYGQYGMFSLAACQLVHISMKLMQWLHRKQHRRNI